MVWRKPRGRAVIVTTFNEIEVALLSGLLNDLDDLAADLPAPDRGAADPSAADPVIERLYPAGYTDPEAAREFRELTQSSLMQERRQRYGQCRAELPDPAGQITIEADSVQRWLIVLNDMRLALGTRLGVTAEGFDADAADGTGGSAPDEHELAARTAYHWLTYVQDGLITAAMG